MIDAVLFDWGGTLTPYHDVDLLGFWAAAARVMAPDRIDEVASALLAAERDAWPLQQASMISTTTAQLLRSASDAAGIDVDVATFDVAAEAYHREWAPYMAARPEAAEVLGRIRARGLRTGMLSNTHWPREWHEAALAADGLIDLLDARIYTSELSHMKPHPSAFAALLDAVGTTSERAIFVGDRLHDDISGAQGVGLRAVWLRNEIVPGYDVAPDATIEQLSELLALLDQAG